MSSIRILEISSSLTESGKELSKSQLLKTKGTLDYINLNGTLVKVRNGKNENSHLRVGYVGGIDKKSINKDTRTYKQMDALEIYVLYHLLQNPSLLIIDAGQMGGQSCLFDVGQWLKEIGVHKRHHLIQAKL